MSLIAMQIEPVPPNQGGVLGKLSVDDQTGALTLDAPAASILRRDRERFGDDKRFGAALLADGWSNGQVWLVRA